MAGKLMPLVCAENDQVAGEIHKLLSNLGLWHGFSDEHMSYGKVVLASKSDFHRAQAEVYNWLAVDYIRSNDHGPDHDFGPNADKLADPVCVVVLFVAEPEKLHIMKYRLELHLERLLRFWHISYRYRSGFIWVDSSSLPEIEKHYDKDHLVLILPDVESPQTP